MPTTPSPGYGGMSGSASDPTQSIASDLKDKVAEVADSVQQASEEAYQTAKQVVEERPVLVGLAAATIIGFAIGALWMLRSRPSTSDRALGVLHSYADPHLRALRKGGWL